jgi:hypothetical protein
MSLYSETNLQQGMNKCGGEMCDYNYMRYVGWQESNASVSKYYSPDTVKLISRKVSELTRGVDPKGRKIVVPDKNICSVLDAIYVQNTPAVGDIFTRYIIPNNEQENLVQSMIDQTIEIIVDSIKGNMGMEQANEKLSAWVQVLGDFNTHGLRQHAPIKTLENRPSVMQFNMNY